MNQNQNPNQNLQPGYDASNQPYQPQYQQANAQQQTDYAQTGYQQYQQTDYSQTGYQQYQQTDYSQTGYQQYYQQEQNQYQQVPDYNQTYQEPVYANAVKPVKKSLNPLIIIAPLVLIVAATAFFLFFGKQSYRKIEQNFFKGLSSSFTSVRSEAIQNLKTKPQSVKFDFETPYLPSGLSAQIDTVPNANDIYSELSVLVNSGLDNSIRIQTWLNLVSKTVQVYLPDISDVSIKMALESLGELSSDTENGKYTEALNRVLSKAIDTYFELVGDPKIQSNQSFEINGKSYIADKCVIVLDVKQLSKIIKVLLESAISDNEFLSYTAKYISQTGTNIISAEELKSQLNMALSSLESELAEIKGDEASLEMNVYIQKNTVVGREITLKSAGNAMFKLRLYNVKTSSGSTMAFILKPGDGSDFKTGMDYNFNNPIGLLNSNGFGSKLSAFDSGDYTSVNKDVVSVAALSDISVILEDTLKGEAHDGKLTINIASQITATCVYSDLALTDKLCQGTATFSIDKFPAFTAALKLEKSGENNIITLSVPNICSLKITSGPSKLAYKQIPNIPSDNVVVIDPNNPKTITDNPAFIRFYEDMNRVFKNGNIFSGFNF